MADIKSTFTNRPGWQVCFALAQRMVRTRSQRVRTAIGVGLEAAGIGLGIAGPFALKQLMDGLSARNLTAFEAVSLVAIFVFSWGATSICSAARVMVSTRIIDDMTGVMVSEVLRAQLPVAATARQADSGRLLGLIERLPFSLLLTADGIIWRAGPLALQLLATLIVVSTVAPGQYVVGLVGIAGAYVVVTQVGSRRHQFLSAQTNAAIADVSQNIGDILRNARRVVLNGGLDMELRGVEKGYVSRAVANQVVAASLVRLTILQYGGLAIGLLGLLGMCGFDVLSDRLSLGDFVLVQTFALRLILPLSGFAFVLSQAAVSIATIRDVLDLLTPEDPAAEEAANVVKGSRLTLQQVSFSYGRDLPGIVDVSVEVPPGGFVVVVGANGSGKSTLSQIMAGVLTPGEGSVQLDGFDLNQVPKRLRHRYVLYVPQFIGLFNRSLRANAMYPPGSQSEDDLARLLEQWRFYEAGRSIDFGTPVGEQGERLSGGQIQKLELARIAGVDVPVVILDESTSALDPASEVTIIAELRYRFGTRTTVIMISHHEQMAQAADLVLFMEAGRLTATGAHHKLLEQSPNYRNLWALPPQDSTRT